MTGLEILAIVAAIPTVITGLEVALGAMPNNIIPYRSRVLKALAKIKSIAKLVNKIDKR